MTIFSEKPSKTAASYENFSEREEIEIILNSVNDVIYVESNIETFINRIGSDELVAPICPQVAGF